MSPIAKSIKITQNATPLTPIYFILATSMVNENLKTCRHTFISPEPGSERDTKSESGPGLSLEGAFTCHYQTGINHLWKA